MNKKSKAFEKNVVSMFVDRHLQTKDISKQLKCSTYVILRILKDYNIDPQSNYISKKDQRFKTILSFYRETQDISKTLSKFGKYKNDVYSVFEHEDVLITDETIIAIFVGKTIKHGNVFHV